MPPSRNFHKQGAEGIVYLASELGQDVAIKHRFKKAYRLPEIDTMLTSSRLKQEVRSILRARRLGVRSRTLPIFLLVAALLVWTTTRFQRKPTISVLTMTYSKRRALLDGFVAHFSACPSIDSIVVVWNGADVDVVNTTSVRAASQVPVRFRVEPNPSMNNRYKPDPQLDSALLILDDDLRIDCESIQRALDEFHRSRRRNIVGWFPRFAVLPAPDNDNDNPSSYSYIGEPGTVRRGEYNMVLSGAAVVDTGWFELYSSSELAGLRELVDDVWNCDDILFNFVVASAGGATTYLRPRSLVDLSHETGVGIRFVTLHGKAIAQSLTRSPIHSCSPVTTRPRSWKRPGTV